MIAIIKLENIIKHIIKNIIILMIAIIKIHDSYHKK